MNYTDTYTRENGVVAEYTWDNGDNQIGICYLSIEQNDETGSYRFVDWDDSGTHETSDDYPTRERAVQAAIDYARTEDESPKIENIISAIIATGWLGDRPERVKAVIDNMINHEQGYILVSKGDATGVCEGGTWDSGNGYLQDCEYLRLSTIDNNESLAARRLLAAIESEN